MYQSVMKVCPICYGYFETGSHRECCSLDCVIAYERLKGFSGMYLRNLLMAFLEDSERELLIDEAQLKMLEPFAWFYITPSKMTRCTAYYARLTNRGIESARALFEKTAK